MEKQTLTVRQQEIFNLFQEHLSNITHKCFQSCTPHTNNIIYFNCIFVGEEEPIATVIVRCPKCKQLTYLLYRRNYATPIYRKNYIDIPFINSFFKQFSPDRFDITVPFYQHLISTLHNFYMHLLIQGERKKQKSFVDIPSILGYCRTHTLMTQPISFLQNALYSDDTKKNREILLSILSLSRKQIHEINTLAREKY